MSSRRSGSHSTGSVHAAYIEDESSFHTQSPTSESDRSLSSEDSSWDRVNAIEDEVGPDDSASHPPRAPSVDTHSSRRSSRHAVPQPHPHPHDPRPVSTRRKSSHRLPTLEEDLRRPHRTHSDRSERHSRRHRIEEREHYLAREQHLAREHRPRVPSSSSSSTDSSYESYYMGGGGHHTNPYHPDPHAAPYPHAQSSQHPYAPSALSGHAGYDAHGRPVPSPYDAALIHMPRYDPMAAYGGYAAQPNPLGPPTSSSNPFSPMTMGPPSSAGDYFPQQFDRPSPHTAHHPAHHPARPMPRSRPQSYGGAPYPGMEHALAHYYPPPSGYPGYPPPTDPSIMAAYMAELRLRDTYSHSASPEPPRSAKSKSPVASPPPAEVKEEPKEDQAVRLMALIAEHEEKKRLAAEARAREEALIAAAEKAKKDATDMESAKIAKLLQEWKEEEAKNRKAEKEAAEAAQKEAEAQAARDAEIAAAATAAREAAEKEAAAKAKAAEEESKKKIDEATAAAAALEKAKKELEDNLAKIAPQPDDKMGNVHFHDALNRKYDVPWRYAKTWKGMKGLIEQAFSHVDGIGQNVMDGRYDLIGPEGNIILPVVWDIVIQPEWDIRMELWPEPEPEPPLQMPGVWPMPVTDSKQKKPGKGEKKGSKPKKSSSTGMTAAQLAAAQAAAAGMSNPMAPPPIPAGGHVLDDPLDPFVSFEIGDKSKANKSKKRAERPAGFLSAWIGASAGGRSKPSGKDSEKPGAMVHFASTNNIHTTTNSNNRGNAEQKRRSNAASNAVAVQHQHDKRRVSDHDDFFMVSRRERSAAQGKSVAVEVPQTACAVM